MEAVRNQKNHMWDIFAIKSHKTAVNSREGTLSELGNFAFFQKLSDLETYLLSVAAAKRNYFLVLPKGIHKNGVCKQAFPGEL